ncbi:hypothetical protein HQ533_05760 [Candidatus Woesearchaeota archaeon]|nr:hypothetical protein [Candidatus Woesearchaeota archaeon]
MLTAVITKKVLDASFPYRRFFFGNVKRWRRHLAPDNVEAYILYYARLFREGESVEKIIDLGNNFETKEVFYDTLDIASKIYGIRNINYKTFRFMNLKEAKQILTEYQSGTPAHKLVKKHGLLNDNVVYHLKRDLNRRVSRLFSVLGDLHDKKFVEKNLENKVSSSADETSVKHSDDRPFAYHA